MWPKKSRTYSSGKNVYLGPIDFSATLHLPWNAPPLSVSLPPSLSLSLLLSLSFSSYSLGDFVDFPVKEVGVKVKVLILEHPFADDLVWHLAFQVHHVLQHLENTRRISE